MNPFFRYRLDHALFWALTIFFHGFTRTGLIQEAGLAQFLLELIVRNGLLALLVYFNLWVIIPRFNKQENFIVNILLILASIFFYSFTKNAHDVYLYGFVLGNVERQYFFNNTLYNLSIGIFYLAFAVTLHFSKEWYQQRAQIRKIEVERLHTELEYLKAQINPHFLFNSINTIYFQIDKQNADARETLSKFSEMLRYQLYECNGKEIAVEKEISYLKNYVELQRLRKDENYKIDFKCSDDLTDFTIAPLLLIPFVENAFKHLSHHNNRENEVSINLQRTGNLFQMRIINTRDRTQRSAHESRGIGLKNVKRRLELLYNGSHLLDINEMDEKFEVNLQLKI